MHNVETSEYDELTYGTLITKHCITCGEIQPYIEFHRDRTKRDGYRSQCKTCTKASIKGGYKQMYAKQKVREKQKRESLDIRFIVQTKLKCCRSHARREKYIPCLASVDDLIKLFTTFCEACKKEVGLSICLDHCHSSGKFRSFLCSSCNVSLGSSKDNPNVLRKLAEIAERCKPDSEQQSESA